MGRGVFIKAEEESQGILEGVVMGFGLGTPERGGEPPRHSGAITSHHHPAQGKLCLKGFLKCAFSEMGKIPVHLEDTPAKLGVLCSVKEAPSPPSGGSERRIPAPCRPALSCSAPSRVSSHISHPFLMALLYLCLL